MSNAAPADPTPETTAAALRPDETATPRDHVNLRTWFDGYLTWMIVLAVLVVAGRAHAETGGQAGFIVMVLAAYGFYLSLCCTFCPAPTTWAVMLIASNELALFPSPVARVAAAAGFGAVATAMANLNEYHILTFLLRYGRVARVRETRLYRWAARWFAVSPFTIVSLFAFIPIPVDVVRWLATACRYARTRFFAAYMLGRSLRYAIWATSAVWLDLAFWQIMVFQCALVALAGLKVGLSALARRRQRRTVSTPAFEASAS
ncbi:MAG: hypothetical protein JXA69_02150 [Phycisphaerae bacterium]|nr:hypothetical protein [Phycisphaerae bacterium]